MPRRNDNIQLGKERMVRESIDFLIHYDYGKPVVPKKLYVSLDYLIKGYKEEKRKRKEYEKKYGNSLTEFYGCQATARRNEGRYKFACDYIDKHIYKGQSGCEFASTIKKYSGMENFVCPKQKGEEIECKDCIFHNIEKADLETSIIDKFM